MPANDPARVAAEQISAGLYGSPRPSMVKAFEACIRAAYAERDAAIPQAERLLSVLETTRVDYICRMPDRVRLIETDCGAMIVRGEGCTLMAALEDALAKLGGNQ